MFRVSRQGNDLSVFNRCQHAAGVGAVKRADCFAGGAHSLPLEKEVSITVILLFVLSRAAKNNNKKGSSGAVLWRI